MRIFVIGGVPELPSDSVSANSLKELLYAAGIAMGDAFGRSSHDVIVCSPYPDSVDHYVLKGLARHVASWPGNLHIHHPDDPQIRQEITSFAASLGLTKYVTHPHAPPEGQSKEARAMAWLLSQLAALDSADVVIAIGGKNGGPAALLLQLTKERRRPVLPFEFVGGVAAHTFLRLRYELLDRLGEEGVKALQNPARVDTCVELATQLVSRQRAGTVEGGAEWRPVVFISYPRARPAEADFVEMNLRRRGIEVIRDEHSFGAGYEVPGQISEGIHRANVFIALWCQEYACSPWCFDELEMALDRQERVPGNPFLTVAILCLDETRVIPKRARNLLHFRARSRDELLAIVLRLLENSAPRRWE